jgi:hypothetical protein
MFLWTIIILAGHILTFWDTFDSGPELQDIKPGLLTLMGVSNGVYLGVKAAGNNALAGDVAESGGQQGVVTTPSLEKVKESDEPVGAEERETSSDMATSDGSFVIPD